MVLTHLAYRHVHAHDLSDEKVNSIDDASRYWCAVYLATTDNSNGRPKYRHHRHPVTRTDVTKEEVVRVEDLDTIMAKMTFDKAPRKVKHTIRVKGEAPLA